MDRLPNETSSLVMVLSFLEQENANQQKVGVRAEDVTWTREA